jgi:hypothetical protein
MKKFWVAVFLVAVVAGLFFIFRSENAAVQNPAATNTTSTVPENNSTTSAAPANSDTGTGANPASPNDLASHAASPAPVPTEISTLPPLTVLDNARVAIHNYNEAFGENPVGDNSEITAALMGKNPKQINFITAGSGLRVDDKGELLDGWGTPFFFHQISGQETEIRSAGEDRKMWTFDDLVTK